MSPSVPQSRAKRDRRPRAKQLTAVEVAALADGYRSGATVYELATKFSLHRNTVSQHLHRQGVAIRRQGLDDDQIDHAVQLYQSGQSLARIGTLWVPETRCAGVELGFCRCVRAGMIGGWGCVWGI
jgi:DNA-binding transcriptional ArsR family regulator